MLRVIAKRTGYCDGFDNLRMNKVSVTALGRFDRRNLRAQGRQQALLVSAAPRHLLPFHRLTIEYTEGDSCAC